MSGARRAYDILRGYVNHGWETLQGGEEDDAERELREAMSQPTPAATIRSEPAKTPAEPQMTIESARRLLDVTPTATSREITAAYMEVHTLINPSKFSKGTAAYDRATGLQKRLDAARSILIENLDPTIRRFEALEIE